MKPLAEHEKARFDSVKQVARSSRPADLRLWRGELDGTERAIIVQRVIDSDTAETVGWQPLALVITDAEAERLRLPDGQQAETVDPEGLEGAA